MSKLVKVTESLWLNPDHVWEARFTAWMDDQDGPCAKLSVRYGPLDEGFVIESAQAIDAADNLGIQTRGSKAVAAILRGEK